MGSLAKWLRLLGLDVLYPQVMEDRALLNLCKKEGRTLLTKDRKLAESEPSGIYLVQSQTLEAQVEEILHAFRLKQKIEPLSRCSLCNTLIQPISKEEIRSKVPPKVYASQAEFWYCPGCEQIYWQGTHWDRMRQKLERLCNSDKMHKGREGMEVED